MHSNSLGMAMKMRLFLYMILVMFIHAQTFTVASWNVENLFDMHRDGTEYEEYVPGRHGWSGAMLRKKVRNLTEVICDLEADVVALQEVENDRALARLQESLKRAGCPYRYRAITHTKTTPIHNALLSKIPFKRVKDVAVTRYGHQRSILEAVLDTDPPLRVFNNHWRSKRGPESERMVYAKALKTRLEKLPKGAEYLLAGDFNSNWNESLTITKKHNDTHNRTGINTVLKTMRGERMVRLGDLQKGEHYNLWLELGTAERWSHNFFGKKEAIDAILIPYRLHDGQGWEYVPGSFRVYKPRYLFGRNGRINRWSYRHGKHQGEGYSDHLPIVATFSNDGAAGTAAHKASSGWWNRLTGWLGSLWEEGTGTLPKPVMNQPAVETMSDPDPIAALKESAQLDIPVTVEEVCVIWKDRDSAVIRQRNDGEAILIYRAASALEKGQAYDLTVHRKKRYKGMDELTDVEVARSRGACDAQRLIEPFDTAMMDDLSNVGKVVRGIEGVYRKRAIEVEGTPVRIHFRKRAGRPKDGQHIRIDRAVIGYYKDHMELQVWGKGEWN